ncbi:MAG: class I SAM-dependent methyltransferase [Candidatus Dojkabacteria bacterium]|nr:class I SAM-dependent methyltransferase [Candidatus Dojkabacteria bacterium]
MTLVAILSLLIMIFLLILFFVIWFWINLSNKSPYYPSIVKKIQSLVDDKEISISANTKFVDLGSGDGRVVFYFAKLNILQADGIEINPFLSLLSRFLKTVLRLKNVKIYNKDFLKHDLGCYNLVYMFLIDNQIDKLLEKIKQEKKNSEVIVISNTFQSSKFLPYKKVDTFYFYKI